MRTIAAEISEGIWVAVIAAVPATLGVWVTWLTRRENRRDHGKVQDHVRAMRTDLAEVKADVATVRADVAEVRTNVAGLQARVDDQPLIREQLEGMRGGPAAAESN